MKKSSPLPPPTGDLQKISFINYKESHPSAPLQPPYDERPRTSQSRLLTAAASRWEGTAFSLPTRIGSPFPQEPPSFKSQSSQPFHPRSPPPGRTPRENRRPSILSCFQILSLPCRPFVVRLRIVRSLFPAELSNFFPLARTRSFLESASDGHDSPWEDTTRM